MNPRKRVPARLQASNRKTTYSDLSALFGVIVSFLLVLVAFLAFGAIFCAICVQAGIYLFQLKQIKQSAAAATKAAHVVEASVTQARGAFRDDQRAWYAWSTFRGFRKLEQSLVWILLPQIPAERSLKT